MKKKELLKQIIRNFHVSEKFEVIPRDIVLPIDVKKIITLIGVRRCGKTSVFYDAINKLAHSIDKTKILFLNFEDERLELSQDELDLVIQAYMELYPENELSECHLFFDEIQNVSGWEKFVRRIYDTLSKNIYVTGSNSKLLSSEIATSLRGRTITYEIYPLSFNEYLRFLNIEIDLYSSKSLAYIKNAMDKFLRNGAFPEIVLSDEQYIDKILQEYFNVLLYKDLCERYNITNTVALKYFLKRVLSSTTKQISINKIYNDLKSSNIKIGKNTLYDFLDYAQSVYLSLTLHRYDTSLVAKELGEKKIYTIDIGLNNAIEFKFSDNIGKSLENGVYLELRRQSFELYYDREAKYECDFLITNKSKITHAIQVTYDMEDLKTRDREIKGLLESCEKNNLSKGFIITYDYEDEITIDGITIQIIPFYKFTLKFKDIIV